MASFGDLPKKRINTVVRKGKNKFDNKTLGKEIPVVVKLALPNV